MNKHLAISIPDEDLDLDVCSFFMKYEKHFHDAFEWVPATCESYRGYISSLVPYTKGIPFADADHEDFARAIRRLNEEKKGKKYSENTLKVIGSIFSDICYFAEVYSRGRYRNALWGTNWNVVPDREKKEKGKRNKRDKQANLKEIIERRTKLPKSLSIREALKFLEIVTKKSTTDCLYLGMAIMFYMGLRPGECCGLHYGDIRPLDGHPEVRCLYVYEQIRSTKEVSNQLKTSNAYRVLPIPAELDMLIKEHERFIATRFERGFDFSEYRIMHQSNDMYGIQQDCNPKKFMKLCKDALRDATVKESVMSEMSLLMNAESEYSESSPTSYLLRRNFATDISSVCGMDEDEIKYMIGHAIYIPEERRSDFLNPDTLYRLWEKLNRRQFFHQHPSDFEITNKAIEIRQKEASVCVSEEQLAQHPDGVLLKVWNDYPNDYIKLSVNEGSLEGSFMSVLQEPVPLRKAVRVKIYREFSNAVAQSRNRMRKSKSKNTT